MRLQERLNYLKRARELTWDILVRGRYDFEYDLMPVQVRHMPLKKRLNLLMAGANLIHRRAHAWSRPVNMHIELTNYCNLRCTVCPSGTGRLERQPMAMDPALFERVMNEAGPYLLTTSLWGWGEPLLHPQLADILRIAQNGGVTTFLSTNGQALDDETVLRALVDYPPTYLLVALDGLTDETNSVFRVGAQLAPALAGVKRLVQMRREAGSQLPVLHLRFIVMKHNEHEVPGLRQFAVENQFDVMSIRTLSVIDAPEGIHKDLVPDNEDFRAYGYSDNERINRDDFMCEKAFTFPAVFADGTIVSCDQDCNAQQTLGRLANGSSFTDIWWSREADRVRKTIRDNPDDFSFCKQCPFRDRDVGHCSVQYFDLREGVTGTGAGTGRGSGVS